MFNKQNQSISKFDRFFVLCFSYIDDKVLSSSCFYLSGKLVFMKSYLDRLSFSMRANSAALSSFP
jgi:hypothetical protein